MSIAQPRRFPRRLLFTTACLTLCAALHVSASASAQVVADSDWTWRVSGIAQAVLLRAARNENGERSGVSPPVPRFLGSTTNEVRGERLISKPRMDAN